MKITNLRYCTTFFSQARGLMFRSKQNLVMEFPTEQKVRLHMFFVFYPIDVLILNSEKRVVEIKKNFRPFTIWNSKLKGKYVVETPFTHTFTIGDHVTF